jgi:periplasmic protein TonB
VEAAVIPLPASAGDLPRRAHRQFVPPSTTPPEFKPALLMEATLVAPVETQPNPLLTRIGDPFGRDGLPSDGPGSNGGIGAGTAGGVGNRRGPGFGDHDGGGFEFNGRMGGGVVAPVVLHRVDPEFLEEARKAKHQGTVLLTIEVGEDGKPHGIRVVSGLGLGLDEKAIEAVSQWRFKPATRNGRPVASSRDHRSKLPAALNPPWNRRVEACLDLFSSMSE